MTRANIKLYKLEDTGAYKVCYLYKHSDGYPKSLGEDLSFILIRFINDVSVEEAKRIIMQETGCEETDRIHSDIDYLYDINLNTLHIDTFKISNTITTDKINQDFNNLRENIRHRLSAICFSKGNPFTFNLPIDVKETMGLCENQKIQYTQMEEDSEGILWFTLTEVGCIEFDDVPTEDLINIVNEVC